MQQVIGWVTELNRSDHTAFAVVTVLTMAGLGGCVACIIELFFVLGGIRACRSQTHGAERETACTSNPSQGKEV